MLDKDEAIQLKKACEALTDPVEFTLYQREESEFSRKLKSFVDEVCRLSQGKIRAVAGQPDPDVDIVPCFRMSVVGRTNRASGRTNHASGRTNHASGPNIVYAAVPLGHQFAPFIDSLELIGGARSPGREDSTDAAGSQAELQILISEHCPRCPVVVGAAFLLSSKHSLISSTIVDAAQFPEIVQKFGIKSVPATILDRRLVLIGNISADRLLELVEIRGTLQFEMEVVQSLIDTGRIPEAAACLDQDAGREVILGLVQDLDFSRRLSGMVVMERALDDCPDAVRALVPSLAGMLSHEDSRIRGDVADFLGRIGDPQVIPQLEPLVADSDPDVAEAATDAIEALSKIQ